MGHVVSSDDVQTRTGKWAVRVSENQRKSPRPRELRESERLGQSEIVAEW